MTQQTVSREAIEQRISEALVEFGAEQEQIKPEASWEQLDIDSLDLVELAQIVEEEYGVELRETDMEGMDTVGAAVELIAKKIG